MPPQDISGKDGAGWTPGPWAREPELDPCDLPRPWIGRIEERRYSALACGETAAEANANADLIAAAPALYEALLGILETPLTTCDPRNPADWPKLVEFWQYELEQGRGQASFELAAYAALSLAHGEQP